MFASLAALVVTTSTLAAEPAPAVADDTSAPSYLQPIYVDPPPGHYDPPPGFYDPPPAYYESDPPGGPPIYKDPPAGYYDPPPGWYDPPPGYYLPPAGLPAPLPIPSEPVALRDDAWEKWARRHDQLRGRQIGWGVALGLSVLTLGLVAALPPPDCRDCGILGRPVFGIGAIVLGKISLVSTIINGVALARHNRNRPGASLSLGPGSVQIQF